MYLTDLLGSDKNNFRKQIVNNVMCYIVKPKEIIKALKTFNFYQEEFQTSKEETWEEEYELSE